MDQTCKYCGTPLEGYETFCPGCGRELPGDDGAGFRPDADSTEDTYSNEPVRRGTFQRRPEPAQSMSSDEWFPTEFDEPDAPPVRRTVQRTASDKRPPQRSRTAQAVRKSQPARQSRPQRTASAQARRMTQTQSRRTLRKPASQPLTGRNRLILLGALGALALVLLICGVGMLFGGEDRVVYPFTPVVDQYFTSVRTANANTYIATRPDLYTTYLTTGPGSAYKNESDYRAQTAATLQARLAEYQSQFGDIRSITYELTSVTRYNHRCAALSDVLTGWYGFPENAVSDAYIVKGVYTVKGEDGSGSYAIDDLLLIKIDESWYFSPDAGSYWRAE